MIFHYTDKENEVILLYQIQFSQGLDGLPKAAQLRQEVFIHEQGFQNEFDETDPIAWHVLVSDGGVPCGTGRVFESPIGSGCYHLGRIAVKKTYRKHHIGSLVLKNLEEKAAGLGARELHLSAQVQAQGFYEKNGYHAYGPVYPDEHVPHIGMKKIV